jgi:outer membrane lipoprotein-sorting protein
MKNYLRVLITLIFIGSFTQIKAQDITTLVQKVKNKLDQVNDYVAEGKMKTDVAFIKAPVGKVKVYFKKPDKFKLKRDAGISLLPKGGVTVNMRSLVAVNDYTVIAAGETIINGIKVKIAKLLPNNDNSDIVLSTLYIDETNLVIIKATTTTKENGTYDIEMQYGKYINYGLPDKVVFAFNTKDYKMPKGVTMEFDNDVTNEDRAKMKNKKGRVELAYNSYIINKGFDDSIFKN